MRAQFVRGTGSGSREEILDKILNRKITIAIAAANVTTDQNGKVSKGMNEDNDYFLDVLKKSGAEWRQLDGRWQDHGGIPFEFRGTKEQLIPIIGMWDAHSRTNEELAEALEDWDGSDEELWEIIG